MSKDNNVFQYLIAPIIVALLVGGTSPWWWQEFFSRQKISDASPSQKSAPSNERGPETDKSLENTVATKTTSIQVLYRGDYFYCTLSVGIVVGGKQAEFVRQNQFVVGDVELGSQPYSIDGQVSCPQAGSCQLTGQGNIDIIETGNYYLVWQGNRGLSQVPTSQCTAALNS